MNTMMVVILKSRLERAGSDLYLAHTILDKLL